jgi:hypothetical protein
MEEINRDDFHYNEKNMLRIIKLYNLKNFQKPNEKDYQTVGTVSFYTRAEGKAKESITVQINDSLEYKLPASHPLPVKLPLNKPTKVCVLWESGTHCELVEPNQFATTYYEIRYFINKSFELEKKSYREIKSYLLRARPN